MEAEIINATIAYGKARYRVQSDGNWLCLMFGTFGPEDNGIPYYKWMPISADRVPEEVKKLAVNLPKG